MKLTAGIAGLLLIAAMGDAHSQTIFHTRGNDAIACADETITAVLGSSRISRRDVPDFDSLFSKGNCGPLYTTVPFEVLRIDTVKVSGHSERIALVKISTPVFSDGTGTNTFVNFLPVSQITPTPTQRQANEALSEYLPSAPQGGYKTGAPEQDRPRAPESVAPSSSPNLDGPANL